MFLYIIIVLIIVLYVYGTKTYNYWNERGIVYRKPIPFFGNCFLNYLQKQSQAQLVDSLYKEFPDAPVIGFYKGFEPRLIVRDPDIIKHVLSKDFPYFYARGEGRNRKLEPLLDNPFHAEGNRWKAMRQRLTPAFTSGKLKAMFPLIVECAEQLQEIMEEKCEKGVPVDMRETMARFTTDFIGACGFGIKMNSMNNNNSQFRQIGVRMFKTQFVTAVKLMIKEMFPRLFRNVKPFDQEVEDALENLVKSICEQRNNKPVGRNDFIDLLLEMQSQGKVAVDSSLDYFDESDRLDIEVDTKFMAAQVFIFFAAGFETSSSATSYTLHQLAYNPHVQKKVQEEIDEVLARHNNKLSYEAVKEMHYLERTLSEGLRMFPSLGVLNRMCTKTFRVPNTDIIIEKGPRVIIPVSSLHHDSKYFDNPEEFDPDRFLPERAQKLHKFVYLPFGEGPRACIGMRLGQMQSMAGLAAVLHRFTLEPVPPEVGGRRDVLVDPSSNTVQSVIGGIPLIIKRRKLLQA